MDTLAFRMKTYEKDVAPFLKPDFPGIIRLDAKNFSKFVRKHEFAVFSETIRLTMNIAAKILLKEIQSRICAYTQSDEISILLHRKRPESELWFGGNVQKICSVAASAASVYVSKSLGHDVYFDCRAFSLPHEDVGNYFLWRQRDCYRNTISKLALQHFSHKQLEGKNCSDRIEMLKNKNISTHLPEWAVNGTLISNLCYMGDTSNMIFTYKFFDHILGNDDDEIS